MSVAALQLVLWMFQRASFACGVDRQDTGWIAGETFGTNQIWVGSPSNFGGLHVDPSQSDPQRTKMLFLTAFLYDSSSWEDLRS